MIVKPNLLNELGGTSNIQYNITTAYNNEQWKYIFQIHIVLCVYIFIQNSLILYHYHKDWKRLSSLLFILIAAADIGFACSVLGRETLVLLCIKNSSLQVSTWITMILLSTSQFWSATSAFLYLILTIVKTINITNPFYRLKTSSLYIAIIIVLLIYFTLLITDNYCYNTLLSEATYGEHKFKCTAKYGLFTFFYSPAWNIGQFIIVLLCSYIFQINSYIESASLMVILEF